MDAVNSMQSTLDATTEREACGPWNPGVASEIPDEIRHLSTFLRPSNVFTSALDASELRDLTGLQLADVVAFRPDRLALHELLIRVTADLSVPDGTRIEDLGINFRHMTRTILANHVQPRMSQVIALYDRVRGEIATIVEREVDRLFEPARSGNAPVSRKRNPLAFLFGARDQGAQDELNGAREARLATEWDTRAHEGDDRIPRTAYGALSRVLAALLVRHGRAWGNPALVSRLATDIAANDCASDAIGRLIEPWIAEAAQAEGYLRLPRQAEPVVMNTKGASASGKSTLRPLQRHLASEIGVDWREFALISPDIWRKQLLDYASLGPHYKYAGAFTGEELRIVDQKLDRYMARKGGRGEMPHLLIDRFRFDSFAPHSDEAGSNLLTRFGRILYLFFMITPPASLVERAWDRGLDVGRYKAVDDTLAHGIEAYAGMPEFFFTWIARRDKRVHFEFLDNSVRLPARPRSVAFGWNHTINILDVGGLLDVERFRRVDIDATNAESLYPNKALLAPAANLGFLRACIARFRDLNFADQASGRIYLRVVDGTPFEVERGGLAKAIADADTRAALEATLPSALDPAVPAFAHTTYIRDISRDEPIPTLGEWGWKPE